MNSMISNTGKQAGPMEPGAEIQREDSAMAATSVLGAKFTKANYDGKSKLELREEVKQQKDLEVRLKNDIRQSDQE